MAITRSELDSKWWYRVLKVLFWFAVIGSGIGVVLASLVLLIDEETFLGAVSVLAGGFLLVFTMSRFIIWIFVYILSGSSDVGLIKGKDKFLLFPKRSHILMASLLGICVLSAVILVSSSKDENTLDNRHGYNPNLTTNNLSILGSEGMEENGLRFSSLEIISLGKTISNDFGYTSWNQKQTSGSFAKIVFSITNMQNSTKSIEINRVELIDQEGRVFSGDRYLTCNDSNKEYSSGFYSWNSVRLELKPGISCRVDMLFEVSSESKSFNLNLSWKEYLGFRF